MSEHPAEWSDCPECGVTVCVWDGKLIPHTPESVSLEEFVQLWPRLDDVLCPASDREVEV